MPSNKSEGIGTKYVREFLSKHKDIPSLTAAKAIYKKHPQLYTDVESVRTIIRKIRGASGVRLRNTTIDKSMYQTPKQSTTWYLPKSDAEKREDFILPQGVTRLGILSDVHLPYHDEQAVLAAVEYLKEAKINGLLINGDLLDFYGISTHEKDPRKRRFKAELEMFKEFIHWIRQELNCPIYYKTGNHESRYERYMMLKAPELLDIDSFKLSEILEFGKHGIIEIGTYQRIRAGKFTIWHGHEFKGSGGVNPARWLALKAKISGAVGHFHKASEHVWRDSNDNTHACYSFGCLCDMSPDYLPENEWTQGFAVLHLSKNGDFVMENKKIINGKVY